MVNEFVHRNLLWILITLGGAGWTLFQYVQDDRYAFKGEAEKTMLMLEIRKQEAYEENDPDSKASPARKIIKRQAEDMLKELEYGTK